MLNDDVSSESLDGHPPRVGHVEEVSNELLEFVIDDLNSDVTAEVNRIKTLGVTKLLQWAYVVTVGTGKTHALSAVACETVKKGWRVAIRTPTLKLAMELQEKINNHCPDAAGVWVGREKDNPRDPQSKMCPRAAEVVAAQEIGGDADDVCGSSERGYCLFHPKAHSTGCGYKKQNLREKHIVIFAGDGMLELAPRKPIKRSKLWRPYSGPKNNEVNKNGAGKGIGGKHSKQVIKFDFDLLLLDETDPQGLIHKGQDGTGLNCSKALSNKLSSDRQSQEIL